MKPRTPARAGAIARRVVNALPDLLESEATAYVSQAALHLLLPVDDQRDPWFSFIRGWLQAADDALIDQMIEVARSGASKERLVFWMADHDPR